MKTFTKAMAAAIILGTTAPAIADTVYFSENFDSYSPTLNFFAFNAPLTVASGTVDVVASNTYSIDCLGGTGNCLDLDGSTWQGGKMSLNLALGAGDYQVSYWASGNQRWGSNDALYFALTGYAPGQVAGTTALLNTFAPDDPFVQIAANFSLLSAQVLTLSWYTASNDNIGPVIDNIAVTGNPASETPEPGTLVLFGLALGGLILGRHRDELIAVATRRK